MTMLAVTERPRVAEVKRLATSPPPPTAAAADPGSDGLGVARGAMIGTVIALFPWSLVLFFLAWLF
jgi:hypothetical protein